MAFSGKLFLADWWYWTEKIARHRSQLKKVNAKYTSKRLKKLYRKRLFKCLNCEIEAHRDVVGVLNISLSL